MQADVAVIVLVYNAGKYLKPCINSILRQSYEQISLILVDDGSKDRSGSICDEFADKDERIFVIHQGNKGSVEARKAGILSKYAQQAEYIFICDADDVLHKNAIEILYGTAKQYNADLVCGQMKRIWKGFQMTNHHKPPCFNITKPQMYSNSEIINELYVSCFGISNFPVNLVAKLYKKELITSVIDFPPVVKFMGDDLSITLKVLPNTKKLIIIPNTVYFYRIGGGTSKYMPYMLYDFLSLYDYKFKLAQQYPMPQDWYKLMNIELMNIVNTYLIMCVEKGGFSKTKLYDEIIKVCDIKVIKDASKYLCANKSRHSMAININDCSYDNILNDIYNYANKNKFKNAIKRIMFSI